MCVLKLICIYYQRLQLITCNNIKIRWCKRALNKQAKKTTNIIKDLTKPYYCRHCILSDQKKRNCKPERYCPIPETALTTRPYEHSFSAKNKDKEVSSEVSSHRSEIPHILQYY